MSANDEPNGTLTESVVNTSPVAPARRRLLRGGLSAVPVILTVSSPSVMATGGWNGGDHDWGGGCKRASAHTSMNASRPETTSTCSGCTPDRWKERRDWPSPCVAVDEDDKDTYGRRRAAPKSATKFHDEFRTKRTYGDMTLLDVLKTTGTQDELARYCVAALLNARAELTPSQILDVGTVKSIWYSCDVRGYYEPTAGVQWFPHYSRPEGSGGVIAWLKSTMPA